VVGLGGAAFPLWAKLDAVRRNKVDTVLVNGAECEPYITSDHRMMLENTEMLVKGVELLKTYVSTDKVVLCIEDNKQDAIDKLSKIFENDPRVEICTLPTIYPQGAKQVLLYNVTGKVVKGGQRMASLGVLILNVSSMTKMAEYIETGMPLVDRIVTVCGSAMKQPTNLIAPIGTPISYIIEQAGGLKEEAGKVLIGGPMLGNAQLSLDAPAEKVTNAVLVMNKKEAKVYEPTTCIRCGRCVANCPAKLNPTAIARAMEEEDEVKRLALLEKTSVGQCIECACCSYVCPAHKPLLEINNEARAFMKNAKKKEGGK
jgi:electron transport complex protein RnfC